MVESYEFRISKKKAKHILRSILISVLIIGALAAIAIPQYSDYTDISKTEKMILLANEAKAAISEALIKNSSIANLDKESLLQKGKYLRYMHVSDSGEIFLYGDSNGTFVILTPKIVNNSIKWLCYAQPSNNVPSRCRGNL